ncbi:MAG: hypothetical protein JW889_16140, partial [Verrucomicrobia bacterium]|nr:hypothetical protein [Verrucomicrobiota bacterium]
MSATVTASDRASNRDARLVARYTNQPAQIPEGLRDRIEASWGDRPVQLYALADLSGDLRLHHTWIAVGPEHVALANEENGTPETIRSFERARIKSVRETPGLSCTVLTILGEPNEPALAVLRYTHRQRRAMENVKFVIQEAIAGNTVEAKDPDHVYAESVAQSVKDAQASVSAKHATVLLRLLGYLKPYRVRLALGFVAASVMTLLMLVPPRLTGYFIDSIVRPFEGGTLTRAQAIRSAGLVVAALAVLAVLREAGLWVRLRTLAVLGEYVARDLRRELYGHIQKLSVSFFSKMKTGSIITRV